MLIYYGVLSGVAFFHMRTAYRKKAYGEMGAILFAAALSAAVGVVYYRWGR